MIIDGKAIASELLVRVREDVEKLGYAPVVRAVVVDPSAATESYLRVKAARAKEAGMHMDVVRLSASASEDELKEHIMADAADAVIVQLPLPASYDQQLVLNAIPLAKDADVLSVDAVRHFELGGDAIIPPVARAIEVVLHNTEISVSGKRAVVVGQGKLVGKPAATLLASLGADVEVVTKESGDLSALKGADIVVLGAGVPRLVKPEHLTQGVVLLDAGTSEEGDAIVGDADPACAEVCSVFTPVPGGLGPVAVACLFKNVAELATKQRGLDYLQAP